MANISRVKLGLISLLVVFAGAALTYAKSGKIVDLQSFVEVDEMLFQNFDKGFCEVQIAKYSGTPSKSEFDIGKSLSDLTDRTYGSGFKILHIGLDAKACILDRSLRQNYVRDTQNVNAFIHLALEHNTIILLNTENKIAYLLRGGW